MADLGGLLNIFGSVPSYASGLLSEEELDAAKGRARANALLQMGQSFYKAGAPRETPGGSALSGVAGALLSGQQAYQGAVKGSIEEKLNEQKIQDALNAKKRQTAIQGLISGAYQPAQAATQGIMDSPDVVVPPRQATPARFDLQAIAPQLMQTAEGRAALSELMGAQEAMQGKTITLAPDSTLLRMGLGGQPEVLATGAPKESPAYKDYQRATSDGSFKGSFLDYQLALKKAGATNVSMGGDKALSSTVGKDIGSMIGTATEQATVARETLDNADRIYSALDKAIVGPAADTRTVLLRVGQSLGVAGKDADEILANTAVLVQGLAKGELQAAAAMKGQGQITENERLIIKRASAGTQNMSATEIKAALAAIRKVAQNKIKRHDTLFNQFKQLEGMEKYAPFYALPPYQPSDGGGVNQLQQGVEEELRRRGF